MGKIILTGASGNFGRHCAKTLIEIVDKGDIILTSSKVEKLAEFAEQGIECREANFNHPEQLEQAFAGGDTLIMVSLAVVGEKRRKMQTAALLAAKAAGIRRIVYTSVAGVDRLGNPSYETVDHFYTENLIKALGFKYVFLRNTQFAEAMVSYVQSAVTMGGISSSNQGDALMAYVSRKDCAEAAAFAAAGNYDDQIFYITGPEAMTLQQFCDIIAPAFGDTKVTVQTVTDEETYAAFDAIGVPRTTDGEWLTEEAKNAPYTSTGMVTFAIAVREGYMDACCDDFVKLTGRPQRTVADMAANVNEYLVGGRNATED